MRFWHSTATLDTDDWVELAVAAEQAGFDGVAVSDHIFYPSDLRSPYPGSPDGRPFWHPTTPWPDPWVLIGAMAAATSSLRFTTNVYVAPARDLLTVAKLVATADVVARGRVSAGVGARWCREEFDQAGQDFATRGARLDEMIPLLRRLWTGGSVTHHGRFFDLNELQMAPVPARPIRVLCGGESGAALHRAAQLCDGWIGATYRLDEAAMIVQRFESEVMAAGRDRSDLEVMLAYRGVLDIDAVAALAALGVTDLITAPWMAAANAMPDRPTTASLAVDAMHRFRAEVIERLHQMRNSGRLSCSLSWYTSSRQDPLRSD